MTGIITPVATENSVAPIFANIYTTRTLKSGQKISRYLRDFTGTGISYLFGNWTLSV